MVREWSGWEDGVRWLPVLSSSLLHSREVGRVMVDWVKSASSRRSESVNAWRR